MAVSINSNVNAMGAIRRLSEASSARSRTFERLSTGSRINRASDDAAGLAVSSTLNAKARVYTQALRNVNDGISYLNVADGGMRELKSVLVRLRELSTQSSNGSFSNAQRKALDKEAQALQSEYNRILDTTKFNGISVFDSDTLYVQAGAGAEGSFEATLAAFLPSMRGDGTFQARQSFFVGGGLYSVSVGDFDGDGVLDLVSADWGSYTASVLLGNGDGTFQVRRSFATGVSPHSVTVADFDGDGTPDLVLSGSGALSVLLGNGDGTFKARRSFASEDIPYPGGGPYDVSVADLNGDGVLDLITASSSSNTTSVLLGNGDGTFQARRSFTSGDRPYSVTVADLDGDGKLDLVSADQNSSSLSVLLGNGDGTFQARRSFISGSGPYDVSVADLNGDGTPDLVSSGSGALSVLLGNGDGTFKAVQSFAAVQTGAWSFSLADFDADGSLDIVTGDQARSKLSVLLGNGDGTFKARRTYATGNNPWGSSVGDFNGDGVIDIASTNVNDSTVSVFLGNGTATTSFRGLSHLSGVSVATQSQALQAQGRIDSYLDDVNSITGVVGSSLSRFQVAASLLSASAEVTKAAESRITDVDVAEESSRLLSTGILQEAAAAVLAHALKGPELALTLFKT